MIEQKLSSQMFVVAEKLLPQLVQNGFVRGVVLGGATNGSSLPGIHYEDHDQIRDVSLLGDGVYSVVSGGHSVGGGYSVVLLAWTQIRTRSRTWARTRRRSCT